MFNPFKHLKPKMLSSLTLALLKSLFILILISHACRAVSNLDIIGSETAFGLAGRGATFTGSVTNIFKDTNSDNSTLIGIGTSPTHCFTDTDIKQHGGFQAVMIAPDLGITPNMTTTATWEDTTGVMRQMSVTWQYGQVMASSTTFPGYGGQVYQSGPTAVGFRNPWCFRPAPKGVNFIKPNTPVTITTSGDWLLIGGGRQLAGVYPLPPIYVGKLDGNNISVQIASPATTITVGKIACAFSSPGMTVPFGVVSSSGTVGQSLASYDLQVNISCTKGSNVTQDIDVYTDFMARKGSYHGDVHKMGTSDPNLYIIGDFKGTNNNISDCASPRGIDFTGSASSGILVGSIKSAAIVLSPIFHFQLCVGAIPVKTGAVYADTSINVYYQ